MKTGWGRWNRDIDLGLAVLGCVNTEGRALSQSEIAEVCGCHRSRIDQIEREAMRKMRVAMEREREMWSL